MNLEPGQVVVLTEGGYTTIGYYDVLKQFDTECETERFKRSETYTSVCPDEVYFEDFITWLIDEQLIRESAKHATWNLGYEYLE